MTPLISPVRLLVVTQSRVADFMQGKFNLFDLNDLMRMTATEGLCSRPKGSLRDRRLGE